MATNNFFKTTGIQARERKMLTINDFGGIDYMSNPLAISVSRAVEMKNFIKRDGVNQKRRGWTQVSTLKDENGNPLIIRNIWNFVASYEEGLHPTEMIVAYTSNGKFWTPSSRHNLLDVDTSKYEQIEWIELHIWNGDEGNIELDLPDKELQAFVSDNKLFILTGVKYLICYLSPESNDLRITLAENPYEIETYIPTVLTGVPRTPTPLDDFNLLNSKIKVKGIFYSDEDAASGNAYENGYMNKYTLSTKLPMKTNAFGDSVYTFPSVITEEDIKDFFTFLSEQVKKISSYYPILKVGNDTITYRDLIIFPARIDKIPYMDSIYINKSSLTDTEYIKTFTSNYASKIADWGYVVYFGFGDYPMLITNIKNKATLIYGETSNNEFEITYDTGIKNADVINKCTFGCLYGNLNNNTLFISGNPENKNIDYHSSGGLGDFTYFSDLDYCAYGTPLTAVKGYNVMNDGSLCILKEYSMQEPTIYYRTATMMNATAYDGTIAVDINGNPLQETQYPLTTGNIGEGLINTNSFKTFVQDTVFLSKNGLFGITTGSNYNSNVKTTRERSRFVNPRLKNYNLENVSTIIFDNKYFISLKDDEGTIYIADSRYKTELTDDLYTYQYEWWVWKNVHAENFFVVGNKLFFSKQDGTLNVFTENSFCDTKVKQSTSVAYDLTENDDVFISDDLPEKANFIYIDNAIFYEDGDALNNILPIKVLSNNEFQIIDENGNSRNITRVELKSSNSLSIKFIIKTPVECLYETVPFSFGTTLHSKYLYQYSLTNNTVEGSRYALGIRTSDELLNPYEDVVDSTSGINFDYFTFMNVSFAQKDFARSYIFKYRVPNINFVQFLFWNRGEENCSVSSLQLLYTIGLVQKGVK